jgi:hypothetical protein
MNLLGRSIGLVFALAALGGCSSSASTIAGDSDAATDGKARTPSADAATDTGKRTTRDAGTDGTASKDGGSDPLAFPKNDYTTETTTVTTSSGTATVVYHLYHHLLYVTNPVDPNYESLDVSVPVTVNGAAVDPTTGPILFSVNVAGYTSSPNYADGGAGGAGGPGGPPGGDGGMGGPPGSDGGMGGPPGGDGGVGGPPGRDGSMGGTHDATIPDASGDGAPDAVPGSGSGSSSAGTGTGSGSGGSTGAASPAGTATDADYFLAAGYTVVSPGCRGRDNETDAGVYFGKAPAAIVDLKAAVRYVRHNAGVLPGNVDRIISTGGSAGAALASLVGASGNSTLYDSDLTALGAASAEDNIFAVAAYSPITNLDHADMSYEVEYGLAPYNGGSTVNQTISGQLKTAFAAYQNGLSLTGDSGYGAITADNITDYILQTYLIPSASEYLSGLTSAELSTYLASRTWITWNASTSTASFTFGDYANYIGRGKSVPAFDAFFDLAADAATYTDVNTTLTPEVQEFGSATANAQHFTDFSLQTTSADPTAVISADMQTTVNMMNPMYFIGAKNPSIAGYWFIRDGAKATDTSAVVIVDLATSLENLLGSSHVDAWEYWDGGHAVNLDPDKFMAWVASIL